MKKRRMIIRLNRDNKLNPGQIYLIICATTFLVIILYMKIHHVFEAITVLIACLTILAMAIIHQGMEIITKR